MEKKNEITKKERDDIFEKEFLPHIDSLYNFATYLQNDDEVAKDLLQETYMRAYRFINYYEKGTNAKAWLIRILKNTFINEYRKKSKAPIKVELEETYQQVDDSSDDEVQNVDLREEVYNNLVGDEITSAVNALPVDYRLIILLCDVEGFKYDEIAKIIDVPIGTVRSRLHRARNMLKDKLKDYAEKRGYKVE
ncbi:MAG: sigma-70 family RNA polymerase sigma factor [Sphingobacteriales bacterium]|nr:MAG: sigma-70 family RNA polymerase sigma factor [Sphingobacteriales bacterium]